MTIGVPKEIKIGETRVSMTPSLCRRCVSLGAKVVVQKSAGMSAGFTDAEYRAAGAVLVAEAAKVWRSSELILKVKPPGGDFRPFDLHDFPPNYRVKSRVLPGFEVIPTQP